jgi:hypothetical protein
MENCGELCFKGRVVGNPDLVALPDQTLLGRKTLFIGT